MKKRISKIEVLSAMRQILDEYRNEIHLTRRDTCHLCILYNPIRFSHRIDSSNCICCPMHVFANSNTGNYGCMLRKCAPVAFSDLVQDEFCYYSYNNLNYSYNNLNTGKTRLAAVIEFYQKVIAAIEKMSYRELNKKDGFKFLVDIDNEVARKYSLKKHIF